MQALFQPRKLTRVAFEIYQVQCTAAVLQQATESLVRGCTTDTEVVGLARTVVTVRELSAAS